MKVDGGRELDAALLELSTAVAKRLGRKSLKDAAAPILADYQSRTKVLTGTLVRNESAGTRLNKRQRRLTPRPAPDELEIHIGTADPAGIQEEFGNRHQGASPSLTPAWDAEGGQKAVDRMTKSLGAGIERIAAKAKKG